MEATQKIISHLDSIIKDITSKIVKLSDDTVNAESIEDVLIYTSRISDYHKRLSFMNRFRSSLIEEHIYYDSDKVFFKKLVPHIQQTISHIVKDNYGWNNNIVKGAFIVLLPHIKRAYQDVADDSDIDKLEMLISISLDI